MTHRRARRLLSSLPDGLLPPAREAAVRRHAAGCTRCRRALADLELAETWLRSLPAVLVPVEPSAAAEARLERLARWSARPRPAGGGPLPEDPAFRRAARTRLPDVATERTGPGRAGRRASTGGSPLRPRARWGIPAVGAAAAAAGLAVVLAMIVPAPPAADAERDEAFNFVLASSFSESAAVAATGPRHSMTGAIRPAIVQSRESESYLLPVGVR